MFELRDICMFKLKRAEWAKQQVAWWRALCRAANPSVFSVFSPDYPRNF
jgi:hypothetical protein